MMPDDVEQTGLMLDEYDELPEPIAGTVEPTPGKCCARTKSALRAGLVRYCAKDPMPNGRCWKHGGGTPSGIASANYQTGRYARSVNGQLAAKFEQARTDPQLLSYRDDVALVDARLAELLERVDSGESGTAWAQIKKLWSDFRRYRASGDVRNMQGTLELLDEPLARGLADHAAWAEIGTLLDRRARLVDAERKRLESMQQVITVEEAMGLLGTVVDVIKRNVTDKRTLDRIGTELGSLVAVDAVPVAARSRRTTRRR